MFVPVNRPLLQGNEKKYVNDCLNSGWISSAGEYVLRFENEFAKYIGRKYAISVSNGSTALDLIFSKFKFNKNDEVIVTNFTIISCVSAIIRAGAKPVFVDVDKETWNMDIRQVKKKINKNTRAILAVHIYNHPVNMDEIIKLCNINNLILIEDAAEQIGQKYKGKLIGSFGIASTFSFFANKNITTGEGGMILTDDLDVYEYCSKYRNLAFEEDRFIHRGLGYNFRMTNIQAAIGLAQLENINSNLERKAEIGRIYTEGLKHHLDKIYFPTFKTKYSENIYWVFGILIRQNLKIDSKTLRSRLLKLGIETRPFFYPMHLQPALEEYKSKDSFSVSENLYLKGLYLPSGIGISNEEINFTISCLNRILNEF